MPGTLFHVPEPALTNVTLVGAGSTSSVYAMNQCKEIKADATWSTGTTGGEFTVEGAMASDYSGTWEPLGTMTAVNGGMSDPLVLVGPFAFIRIRLTTQATGGADPKGSAFLQGLID